MNRDSLTVDRCLQQCNVSCKDASCLLLLLQVRCWEVQQSGTVIPKAQQTHSGPVLDVAWSDVINHFLLFSIVDGNLVDI